MVPESCYTAQEGDSGPITAIGPVARATISYLGALMRPVNDAGHSDTPEPEGLSALDDAALVRKAASGDEAAFEELVGRFGGLVLGLARRKVGREDADDVAQDALLHVWRSLPSLREPQAFIGWLSRLVQNRANRWIQRRSRKLVVLQQARNELLARARARSENTPQLFYEAVFLNHNHVATRVKGKLMQSHFDVASLRGDIFWWGRILL